MIDHRRRSPDGTLQRRIFVALRAVGSLDAAHLADITGAGIHSVRKACAYLVERGKIRRHRLVIPSRGRRTLFQAIGTRAPSDRRGKPAACRNNRGARAYAKWVVMMQRKFPWWRPPVRAGTTLEECWR